MKQIVGIMLIGLLVWLSGCRGPNSTNAFFVKKEWVAAFNYAFPKEEKMPNNLLLSADFAEKKKVPRGLKTKTETRYTFSGKSEELKKVVCKEIWRYDDRDNLIEEKVVCYSDRIRRGGTIEGEKWYEEEEVWYDADGYVRNQVLYKYDDRNNLIEKEGDWIKYVYKYDDRNNLIESACYNTYVCEEEASGKIHFDDNQRLKHRSLSKYDDRGNEIEGTSYDARGKLINKWSVKRKYEYVNQGFRLEYKYADTVGKFGFDRFAEYKYDKDRLIEMVLGEYRWEDMDDGKGTTSGTTDRDEFIFKYDNKGRKIERIHYNYHSYKDGDDVHKLRLSFYDKSFYKYDDRGNQNLIEMAKYEYDIGGRLNEKTLYKYDDRGRKIENANYRADGELIEKSVYKYDDDNQIKEETVYEVKKESGKVLEVPVSQSVWEYEYYPEPEKGGK